jgi:signal transduction histidine kinase/CheY-like chemotaxis protein
MKAMFDRARQWRFNRAAPMWTAATLLIVGLAMAVFTESSFKTQKRAEAQVQAQILAGGVAAALMFDDAQAAQEHVDALAANPEVQAAGVYGDNGKLLAGFRRAAGEALPLTAPDPATRLEGNRVYVSAVIAREGTNVGAVYLRTIIETFATRLLRYGAIGLLFFMAALVLVVLGSAQGALSKANEDLQRRARELSEANASLQVEMETREKAEEALLQSRKLEAIGQLTGGVAHDFNNLLMVVAGGLRLLERNPDAERKAKLMEGMRHAVDRGASLTRQLLAFARRQTLKPESVDLHRQMAGMRELLDRSLRADILIDMNVPEDLWPVRTDPAQLELAVLNLAVNARDAMPNGGVLTISAENAPSAQGDCVRLMVRDTGTGIPPENLARVLEPFFTTKEKGRGSGLGLSQVYGFATQSGGAMTIESEVGQGTQINLLLPRAEHAAEAPKPPESALVTVTNASGDVLVVEDDDGVAELVCEMLGTLGYRALRVSTAAAALTALEREKADLVFSDVIMPGGMNGVELANEIRRRRPELPILLTTGYGAGADVATDFPILRKPYEIEDLGRALHSTVLGRTAPRTLASP